MQRVSPSYYINQKNKNLEEALINTRYIGIGQTVPDTAQLNQYNVYKDRVLEWEDGLSEIDCFYNFLEFVKNKLRNCGFMMLRRKYGKCNEYVDFECFEGEEELRSWIGEKEEELMRRREEFVQRFRGKYSVYTVNSLNQALVNRIHHDKDNFNIILLKQALEGFEGRFKEFDAVFEYDMRQESHLTKIVPIKEIDLCCEHNEGVLMKLTANSLDLANPLSNTLSKREAQDNNSTLPYPLKKTKRSMLSSSEKLKAPLTSLPPSLSNRNFKSKPKIRFMFPDSDTFKLTMHLLFNKVNTLRDMGVRVS